MSTPDIDTEVRNLLERRRGDWPRLAKLADVSHSWMSQFVRGKIPNPGFATLKRLRAALLEHEAPAAPGAKSDSSTAAHS
jgi:transcriptional regulator with XRE-family HTH domain